MANSKFSDPKHLRKTQYKTTDNLLARIDLHNRFSTNDYPWPVWVFDQLDLPSEPRVLDIGPGMGDLWVDNQDRIPEEGQYYLMDISSGMLSAAEKRINKSNFLYSVADCQDLPYPDEFFDVVIANHMLYHVADLEQGLKNIKRVLRQGGMIYTTTNGSRHMHEVVDLINAFDPSMNYESIMKYGYNLENAVSLLSPLFSQIERVDYISGLEVTAADAMLAYFLSMESLKNYNLHKKTDALKEFLQGLIDRKGHIKISKATGIISGMNN